MCVTLSAKKMEEKYSSLSLICKAKGTKHCIHHFLWRPGSANCHSHLSTAHLCLKTKVVTQTHQRAACLGTTTTSPQVDLLTKPHFTSTSALLHAQPPHFHQALSISTTSINAHIRIQGKPCGAGHEASLLHHRLCHTVNNEEAPTWVPRVSKAAMQERTNIPFPSPDPIPRMAASTSSN